MMEFSVLCETLVSLMSFFACFSCVIALKSCTVPTVDIVVICDELEGISSISPAALLSASLTELLVSAASLHHHPVFCFLVGFFCFLFFFAFSVHDTTCLFVVGSHS